LGEVVAKYSKHHFELTWEGPFKKHEIEAEDRNEHWKLYAIYAPHPVYGPEALVYIGKAKNGSWERVNAHRSWFDEENIGGHFFVASINRFTGWENSPDFNDYDGCLTDEDDADIKKIEELLIFALQPTYNSKNKSSAKNSKKIRVFNTGNVHSLPQEISGMFHIE